MNNETIEPGEGPKLPSSEEASDPNNPSGIPAISGESVQENFTDEEEMFNDSNSTSKLPPSMDPALKGSGPAGNQDLLPLTPKEIFRLKSSWRVVHRKLDEAGVEIFLRYTLFFSLFAHLSINNCGDYLEIKSTRNLKHS